MTTSNPMTDATNHLKSVSERLRASLNPKERRLLDAGPQLEARCRAEMALRTTAVGVLCTTLVRLIDDGDLARLKAAAAEYLRAKQAYDEAVRDPEVSP